MQAGDKVTIRRGELKGEVGEVKLTQGDQVALIMERDGALELVNRSNIKELVEATITQAELGAIISSHIDEDGKVYVADLVHNIDAKYPGFAVKAGLPSITAGPNAAEHYSA